MAWYKVGIVPGSQSQSQLGKRSHIEQYIAIGSGTETTATALSASGPNTKGDTVTIPADRAVHPTGDGTMVTDKLARLVSRLKGQAAGVGRRKFEVTVTYSIPEAALFEALPWDRAATIHRGSIRESVPYFIDAEDTPVVNPAGEPFDTMPERGKSHTVFTLVKNYQTPQWNAIEPLLDTVNQAACTINWRDGSRTYPLETLRLVEADEQPATEVVNGVTRNYYITSLTFEYNAKTFKDEILALGYQEIVAGARKPITDADGNQVVKAWPLNLDGTKKATPDAAPEVLTFYPDELGNWSTLPLPPASSSGV